LPARDGRQKDLLGELIVRISAKDHPLVVVCGSCNGQRMAEIAADLTDYDVRLKCKAGLISPYWV